MKLAPRIKVISFDLDNTLWDNDPVVRKAFKAEKTHIKQLFPQVAEYLKDNQSSLGHFRRQAINENPKNTHDLNFIRKSTLKLLAEAAELSVEETEHFIESTFKAFDDTRQLVSNHFYPGTIKLLKELKNKGFILVSNTNGTAKCNRIPELEGMFHHNVCAFTAGALKLHHAPFQKVIDMTNVKKHEILHVGDNIIDDVKGSIQFGMKVVWVNDKETTVRFKPQPTEHLSGLSEAENLLVASVPSVAQLHKVLHFLTEEEHRINPSL